MHAKQSLAKQFGRHQYFTSFSDKVTKAEFLSVADIHTKIQNDNSAQVPTCDTIYLWRLYSAAPMRYQTTHTMTRYPTLTQQSLSPIPPPCSSRTCSLPHTLRHQPSPPPGGLHPCTCRIWSLFVPGLRSSHLFPVRELPGAIEQVLVSEMLEPSSSAHAPPLSPCALPLLAAGSRGPTSAS